MPLRIVQPIPAQMPDAPQHLLFTIWKMFLQPVLEQGRYGPWQTDNCIPGKLRAGFCARFEDFWNLVIGESWNNRRDHYANWNFCCTKVCDGVEPTLRGARARFEHSL